MPEELEKELRREAIRKRLRGEKANAYIYGTMRKIGWTPPTQKSSKD